MEHVKFSSEAAGVAFANATRETHKWTLQGLASLAVFAAVYAEEHHANDGAKAREKGVRKAVVALIEAQNMGYSVGYIYNRATFVNGFLADEKEITVRMLQAETADEAAGIILAHWAGNPAKFGNAGLIQSAYGVEGVTAKPKADKSEEPKNKGKGKDKAEQSPTLAPSTFETMAKVIVANVETGNLDQKEAAILAEYLGEYASKGIQGAAEYLRNLNDCRRIEAEAKAEKPKRQRRKAA